MNLEHLASKLRLDIDHLQYQARTQNLNRTQYRERFNNLAKGYCSLVASEDLPRVEELVEKYEHSLNLS